MLLYHTPGAQSRIRFMSDLCPAESLQALLTCIILPWRSGRWFFERHTAPRAKVFLFFLLQPNYLHLGDGSCRCRMAPLSCLPCIPTFTGNNRNHLAARSDSKSCPNHPAAAAGGFPPPLSFPTSLHQPCSGGLAQESVIAQGMRGAHSSTLGGFSVRAVPHREVEPLCNLGLF